MIHNPTVLTPTQWVLARGVGARVAAILTLEGQHEWAGGLVPKLFTQEDAAIFSEVQEARVAMALCNDAIPDDNPWKITHAVLDQVNAMIRQMREVVPLLQNGSQRHHDLLAGISSLGGLALILESLLPPVADGLPAVQRDDKQANESPMERPVLL